MGLDVVTIACLEDNYAYLLRDQASGLVALVDAPEAAPIKAALEARGWHLSQIWLTHHHWDHVDGLAELDTDGVEIIGAAADAHRLPPLTRQVAPGDTLTLGETSGTVWDVSGHTVGHVAFIFDGFAFTADSLMALGCGRLFEGTPAQMWDSLRQFEALPGDTVICSGHEYTASNARFAATIEPDNAALRARIAAITTARAAGLPTVPSLLSEERATNPFLRAHLPEVKAAIGRPDASDAQAFTEIRARKDRF